MHGKPHKAFDGRNLFTLLINNQGSHPSIPSVSMAMLHFSFSKLSCIDRLPCSDDVRMLGDATLRDQSWAFVAGHNSLLRSRRDDLVITRPQWTLSLYIYGTLTPSHKSGKKWGKVSGPYAVCRWAPLVLWSC